MKPTDVRSQLIDALRLDLVGPTGSLGDPDEILPQAPSRWYLTGFLVPTEADESQRCDPTSVDELDQAAEPAGLDDNETPEPAAARRSYLPSSMGLSLLIPKGTNELTTTVRYGDYNRAEKQDGEEGPAVEWRRIPSEETFTLDLGEKIPDSGTHSVPNGRGLEVVWSIRGIPDAGMVGGLPSGARSVSVFLVNRRKPSPDEVSDEAFIFQAELELASEKPLIARPNLRSLESGDWDERVADLQYRDNCEFSVGHGVSTAAIVVDRECRTVRTCWIPDAEVERVAPAQIDGVELRMGELANLKDGNDAKEKLGKFVSSYREWIKEQAASAPNSPPRRKETSDELLKRAGLAADRIEAGIALLSDPDCLEAFRLANKTMAAQGRRRLARTFSKKPEEITPEWRPFQLAFLLRKCATFTLRVP